MKIADILNFARIQLDVPATSKKQVLETISNLAADSTGCERQIIFDALVERERLGTTGIGKGVAIPHARLAGLKDLYAALPLRFLIHSPARFTFSSSFLKYQLHYNAVISIC